MSTTDTCLRCGQHGHTSSSCKRLGLFHRFPTATAQATKAAAHRLLDRAQAGEKVSSREIADALRITGDLEGERLPGTSPARAHFGGVPA